MRSPPRGRELKSASEHSPEKAHTELFSTVLRWRSHRVRLHFSGTDSSEARALFDSLLKEVETIGGVAEEWEKLVEDVVALFASRGFRRIKG